MGLPRTTVAVLRVALAVALLAISYLAFVDREIPLIDQLYDKLKHAVAFATLAMLLDFSFPASRFGPAKILLLLGYGIGIEAVQHFLPHREASAWDVLADGVGIAAYMLSVPALKRMRGFRLRWQPEAPS
jgi:VanZ family protein